MINESMDPIPVTVRGVIELYATQLAKVAFPDLDAATLRREADELRAEVANVARARAALEAAEAARAHREAALVATAGRAIAYARIYSDAHPERATLATALAELATAAAPAPSPEEPRPAAKRRGRPPKRSAELFDQHAAALASPHEPPIS